MQTNFSPASHLGSNVCGCRSDLCEDVESKHKISEIIDELKEREKKPQKQAKSASSNSTPAHRHGRR